MYLSNKFQRPQILYHGTPHLLDRLDPNKAKAGDPKDPRQADGTAKPITYLAANIAKAAVYAVGGVVVESVKSDFPYAIFESAQRLSSTGYIYSVPFDQVEGIAPLVQHDKPTGEYITATPLSLDQPMIQVNGINDLARFGVQSFYFQDPAQDANKFLHSYREIAHLPPDKHRNMLDEWLDSGKLIAHRATTPEAQPQNDLYR